MADINLSGFEEFDRKGVPVGTRPLVTLQKRGSFSLNRAAYEALGKPDFVVLLFNPKEEQIALRPVGDENPRAYPVRRLGGGRGAANTFIVAGTAFAAHYGIQTDPARRFVAREIGDNVLVIDLKGDATVVTGPRSQSTPKPTRESVTT